MAPRQELIDWFKSNQSTGYTRQQLIDYLLGQGFEKAEVNDAADIALGPAIPPAQTQKPPEPKPAQQPAQPIQYKPAQPEAQKPAQIQVPYSPPPRVQVPIGAATESEPKPPMKIPYVLIGVVIVLAILSFGVYYAISAANLFGSLFPASPSGGGTHIEVNTSGEPPAPVNNTPQPPVSTLIDCKGEISPCFALNYANCTAAKVSMQGPNTSIFYEIIGSSGSLCAIKTRFDSYPDSRFIGKEMICLYNTSIALKFAPQDTSLCSGDLVSLIPIYLAQLSGNTTNATGSSNCTLKAMVSSVNLKTGTSANFIVSGFKGKSTDVSWVSSDDEVLSVTPEVGASVIAHALKKGYIGVIATDKSVGDTCRVAISVHVND